MSFTKDPVFWQLLTLGSVALGSVLLLRGARRLGMVPRSFFLLAGIALGAFHGRVPLLGEPSRLAETGILAAALALFAAGVALPRLASLPRGLVLAVLLVFTAAALAFASALSAGEDRSLALLLAAGASLIVAGGAVDIRAGQSEQRCAPLVGVAALLAAPLAAVLVVLAAARMGSETQASWAWLGLALASLGGGLIVGAVLGFALSLALPRCCGANPAQRLLLFLAAVFLVCATAMAVQAAPLMAVVAAGLILGRRLGPSGESVRNTARTLGRGAELVCLLLLGTSIGWILQVRIFAALPLGIATALGLALVARPICVFLVTRGADWPGWLAAALRGPRGGAVLLLATMGPLLPLAAAPIGRGPGALFDILLVAALFDTIFLDALDAWMRRRERAPLCAEVGVSITCDKQLEGVQCSLLVEAGSALDGRRLLEVAMPEDVSVLLIARAGNVLPARGWSELHAGDTLHLYGSAAALETVARLAAAPR